MHRFSDQPESQIIGRFSRRALFSGAGIGAATAALGAVSTLPATELTETTDDQVKRLLRQWHDLGASYSEDMPDAERDQLFDAMAVIEATMLAAPARTAFEFAAQYLVGNVIDVGETPLYVHALTLTGARS
ncbi:hypothetical protein [Mesorhizobium sp.]|uniref:hypothetical protein n=1 Tax=Mesorhizobium sp. TaxID=1871066 RepID=UPI000FE88121|nr:hypothetical protein [Mesorhizobium sp.]RWO51035.1 MAG: hypothetical protein EOS13_21770 [Mesorhizobium sp.]